MLLPSLWGVSEYWNPGRGKTDDMQKRQEEWMADNKNMDDKKTFTSTFDLVNLSESV